MSALPEFPLRIYFDGSCPLCSREVAHYRHRDRKARLLAIDISAPDFDPKPLGIAPDAFMRELHAIDRLGTVYRGVDAFRAIWQAFPESAGYRLLAGVIAFPGIHGLARVGYRCFARIRPHLPGRRPVCAEGTCLVGGKKPSTAKEGENAQDKR